MFCASLNVNPAFGSAPKRLVPHTVLAREVPLSVTRVVAPTMLNGAVHVRGPAATSCSHGAVAELLVLRYQRSPSVKAPAIWSALLFGPLLRASIRYCDDVAFG